jgi:hypothetical protein
VTCKNFVSLLAIAARRRGVATAFMYGLSLAIRFTSATGEEVEIPPQSMQRADPVISIMTKDGVQLAYAEWSPNTAQPIFLRHDWRLQSCPAP